MHGLAWHSYDTNDTDKMRILQGQCEVSLKLTEGSLKGLSMYAEAIVAKGVVVIQEEAPLSLVKFHCPLNGLWHYRLHISHFGGY